MLPLFSMKLSAQTIFSYNAREEIDTVRTPTHKTVYVFDPVYNRTSKIVTAIAPLLPDVVNNSFSYNSAFVSTGVPFPVSGGIQTVNTGSVSACNVGYYLSTDATLSSNDVYLRDTTFNPLPANGLTNYTNLSITLPATTVAGNYYIICKADYTNTITESNENNNILYLPLTVQGCTPFSVAAAFSNPGGCPTSTNLSMSATGGTGLYTYAMGQPTNWQSSSTFGPITANGNYTIYAKDATGCISSSVININWLCSQSITAAFSITQNGATATFTNQSVNATTYQWDFGDGNTSTSVSPTHTYANTGSYIVKLKAINGTLQDSTIQQVNIALPNCNLSLQIVSNQSPNLISSSNPLVLSVINPTLFSSFIWSDGTTAATTSPATPGNYSVTATDVNNCTYQSNVLLAEYPCSNPPVTVMLADGFPISSSPDTLCTANSALLSLSNPAQWYQWYKDNTAISGATGATYNVTAPGYYSCVLYNGNATTGNVCSTATFSNYTMAYYPASNLSFKDSIVQQPYQTTVYFNSLYTGTPSTSFFWTFGDGQSSTANSPSHTYTTPGVYLVCLKAVGWCDTSMYCKYDTITINYPTPAVPTALTAAAIDTSNIQLSWTHTGTDVQNLILCRSLSPAFTIVDSFVLPVSYSYTDTALQSCTIYYYKIKAKNYTQYSGWSNTAFDTTLGPTPNINIVTTTTNLCGSQADTFTATTNVPNGLFQWKVNGIVQSATGNPFIYNPVNNDTVECSVSAPAGACFSPQILTSNALVINVTTPLIPYGIATVDSITCTNATFNVSFNSNNAPTGSIVQMWESIGSTAFTAVGASQLYSGSSLTFPVANGNITGAKRYFFAITPPVGSCAINAHSDTAMTNVMMTVSPTVSITNYRDTICYGDSVTFVATYTNGGSNPNFTWTNSGFSGPITTSDTLLRNPSNGEVYTVFMQSSAACAIPDTITSAPVSITVNYYTSPYGIVQPPPTPFCSDTNFAVFTALTNIVQGNYTWYKNGAVVGTDSIIKVRINSLSNGDEIGLIIQMPSPSVGCYTVDSIVCLPYTVTLLPTPISAPIQLVGMAGDSLQGALPSSGYTYQWFLGGQAIPNATDIVYKPLQGGIYTFMITNLYGCWSVSPPYSWSPLGIKEPNNITDDCIIVSPNPTSGLISVLFDCPTKGMTLRVAGENGAIIFTKTFDTNLSSYQLEALLGKANGIYNLTFKTKAGVSTKRVVKN